MISKEIIEDETHYLVNYEVFLNDCSREEVAKVGDIIYLSNNKSIKKWRKTGIKPPCLVKLRYIGSHYGSDVREPWPDMTCYVFRKK